MSKPAENGDATPPVEQLPDEFTVGERTIHAFHQRNGLEHDPALSGVDTVDANVLSAAGYTQVSTGYVQGDSYGNPGVSDRIARGSQRRFRADGELMLSARFVVVTEENGIGQVFVRGRLEEPVAEVPDQVRNPVPLGPGGYRLTFQQIMGMEF